MIPANTSIVEREQFITTVSWASAATAGTVLWTCEAPFEMIQNKIMKSAFLQSLYWRGKAHIRIQVQSNMFQCGTLVLLFAPLMSTTQAMQIYANSLQSITCPRHMMCIAGRNETIELEVPFVHFKDSLDLRQSGEINMLGTFLLMVLTPLRVGPAATSTAASVSVFGRFTENQFTTFNPTSVTVVPQGGVMTKGGTNYNLSNVTINGSLDAKTAGDSFSGGKTDAQISAQDKPNLNFNPVPVVSRGLPLMANAVGVDYGCFMDLHGGTQPRVTSELTGTHVDEMDFSYLLQRYCYLDSFVMQTSNIVNSALYVCDLCPGKEFFYLPANVETTLSQVSFVCAPWSRWRGSLIYKIVVVASPAHTARVDICSHVGFEAAGLSINESKGQYWTTLDVVGGMASVEVVFPWRSDSRMNYVPNGYYPNARKYSMGQFSVRVATPLQAPETVSSTIDFVVFYKCGSDFRLEGLDNAGRDLSLVSPDE